MSHFVFVAASSKYLGLLSPQTSCKNWHDCFWEEALLGTQTLQHMNHIELILIPQDWVLVEYNFTFSILKPNMD